MNTRRQTAGLAAYYRKDGDVFLYLQMRDAGARYNPHTLGLFGGGVEEGETLEEALHREIREELGIEIADPTYFRHYDGTIADCDVFLLAVEEAFADSVTVSEGAYGTFISLSSWREHPIADFSQRILADLEVHLSQER